MTARPSDIAGLTAWPLGLSLPQAAKMLGISEDLFTRQCPVIPVRIGSRKLYDRDEVSAWFKGLKAPIDGPKAKAPPLPPRRNILEAVDATFSKERHQAHARRRHG